MVRAQLVKVGRAARRQGYPKALCVRAPGGGAWIRHSEFRAVFDQTRMTAWDEHGEPAPSRLRSQSLAAASHRARLVAGLAALVAGAPDVDDDQALDETPPEEMPEPIRHVVTLVAAPAAPPRLPCPEAIAA